MRIIRLITNITKQTEMIITITQVKMKRNSPASYTNFEINKNERGEQGNER